MIYYSCIFNGYLWICSDIVHFLNCVKAYRYKEIQNINIKYIETTDNLKFGSDHDPANGYFEYKKSL